MVLSSHNFYIERVQAELTADTDGEGKVRIDGSYLADTLRTCGGMVDFNLTNAYSPMLFTVNGFQLVVMPMLTNEANEQAKKAREVKTEQGKVAVAEPATEPVAEQAEPKKAKRSRAKEPIKV